MNDSIFLMDMADNQIVFLMLSTILLSLSLIGMILYIGYLQFSKSEKAISWSKISDISFELKSLIMDVNNDSTSLKKTKREVFREIIRASKSKRYQASQGKRKVVNSNNNKGNEQKVESEVFLNRYINKYIGFPLNNQDVKLERFKLNEVIKGVLDKNQSSANWALVMIYFDVTEQIEIYSDKSKLSSMLNDIIASSLQKYNPEKPNSYIKISRKTEENKISLVISDNGLGLSSEELPTIFSEYNKPKHKTKSPALSLFLVKEYAKKFNTGFNVYSERGEGSMFVLEFDREETSNPVGIESKMLVN